MLDRLRLLVVDLVPARVLVFAALNLSRNALASDLRLKVLDTPPELAVYPPRTLLTRITTSSAVGM